MQIPPALVLGCNTPHGLCVLSDWIEEHFGFVPDFTSVGWSSANKIDDGDYGYDNNDGNGYGSGCGNTWGSGCGHGAINKCISGTGYGAGYGFFYGYGAGNGSGDGD